MWRSIEPLDRSSASIKACVVILSFVAVARIRGLLKCSDLDNIASPQPAATILACISTSYQAAAVMTSVVVTDPAHGLWLSMRPEPVVVGDIVKHAESNSRNLGPVHVGCRLR